jgi:hypothetical protein
VASFAHHVRRRMKVSIAQRSQRRHSPVGMTRQSQRPDSEQATVSRPAEPRPASGRWRRAAEGAAAWRMDVVHARRRRRRAPRPVARLSGLGLWVLGVVTRRDPRAGARADWPHVRCRLHRRPGSGSPRRDAGVLASRRKWFAGVVADRLALGRAALAKGVRRRSAGASLCARGELADQAPQIRRRYKRDPIATGITAPRLSPATGRGAGPSRQTLRGYRATCGLDRPRSSSSSSSGLPPPPARGSDVRLTRPFADSGRIRRVRRVVRQCVADGCAAWFPRTVVQSLSSSCVTVTP